MIKTRTICTINIERKQLIISVLSTLMGCSCSPSVASTYNKRLTLEALSNPDGILFNIKCKEAVPCQ